MKVNSHVYSALLAGSSTLSRVLVLLNGFAGLSYQKARSGSQVLATLIFGILCYVPRGVSTRPLLVPIIQRLRTALTAAVRAIREKGCRHMRMACMFGILLKVWNAVEGVVEERPCPSP